MVRRGGWLLAAVVAGLLCLGCGNSDRDKGKNSDKDRPRPAAAPGRSAFASL
jgi:hypothetical protein